MGQPWVAIPAMFTREWGLTAEHSHDTRQGVDQPGPTWRPQALAAGGPEVHVSPERARAIRV